MSDCDETDSRTWTQKHLDAADVRSSDILAMTPPQGDCDLDSGSVNVAGPDGFTPLMLASCRGGGGLDTGEEGEEDDGSAAVIQDLLAQGANIAATTDRNG